MRWQRTWRRFCDDGDISLSRGVFFELHWHAFQCSWPQGVRMLMKVTASSYRDLQTSLAFSPLQHKDTGSLVQLPELENLTPMQ